MSCFSRICPVVLLTVGWFLAWSAAGRAHDAGWTTPKGQGPGAGKKPGPDEGVSVNFNKETIELRRDPHGEGLVGQTPLIIRVRTNLPEWRLVVLAPAIDGPAD